MNPELKIYRFSHVTKLINKVLKVAHLYRLPNYTDETEVLVEFLKLNRISLVIDVGASIGNFAAGLIDNGYSGKIISLEPLVESYNLLKKRSAIYPKWITERLAVTEIEGMVDFYISENMVSSSTRLILNTHLEEAPESRVTNKISVKSTTIDAIFENYVSAQDRIFLKLDTQGNELEILNSIIKNRRLQGIKVENSLLPLYQNSGLLINTLNLLEQHKFNIWDFVPGFRSHSNKRLLQIDVIGFRIEGKKY